MRIAREARSTCEWEDGGTAVLRGALVSLPARLGHPRARALRDEGHLLEVGLGTIVVAADLRRLHVETAVPTELLLGVELVASPAGEPYITWTAHFRYCVVRPLHYRVDTARRGGGRFGGEEHLASPVVSNVGDVGHHVRVGEVRVA